MGLNDFTGFFLVGVVVGVTVGTKDGALGQLEGTKLTEDGDKERFIVGIDVGTDVGDTLGTELGSNVGSLVGIHDGSDVGSTVGISAGIDVGVTEGTIRDVGSWDGVSSIDITSMLDLVVGLNVDRASDGDAVE